MERRWLKYAGWSIAEDCEIIYKYNQFMEIFQHFFPFLFIDLNKASWLLNTFLSIPGCRNSLPPPAQSP
ncbi:MAG: hypothetical protein A2Y80_00760 [Deltaproteobacteria bacterium RBG_13_58_19]|nr:MAG: hypothetical protein A2Y80_00760 [Deltaproteobacteria bacterium RBG_13_58_19]